MLKERREKHFETGTKYGRGVAYRLFVEASGYKKRRLGTGVQRLKSLAWVQNQSKDRRTRDTVAVEGARNLQHQTPSLSCA